jgi:hypothetical protein
MVPPVPFWPKDFSVIKKDGVYHLFYIRRNTQLPVSQTENDFGHAVSYDLIHWTQAPAVLPTRPSGWDNAHVWAPSIVKAGGQYVMFYAGVTDSPGVYTSYQRIGMATSPDLYNWTRLDQPVYSCAQVPWTHCDSLDASTGFRDPFVMPDPATPGHWLMFYSANVGSDPSSEIIGTAWSDSTFANWSDLGPLWVTYRATTGSSQAESPHLFQHGGLWFLFFTASGPQPIAFDTSPDPLAALPDWTPRGRLGDMLGQNTSSWFASEHLGDGLMDYILFADGDRIDIYLMNWTGVASFTLRQPDGFHVTSMAWEADTVVAGQLCSLRLASVNWAFRQASIEVLALDSLGRTTIVPSDSVDLPSPIPVTQDTLHYTWIPKMWPSGSITPMRILARTTDQTAITPRPLVVLPDTSQPVPPDTFRVTSMFWSPDTVVRGDVATLRIAARGWAEQRVTLAGFIAQSDGSLTPVPLDSLGIPPTIETAADTTAYFWTSRTWPDGEGGPQLTRVVLEVANDTLRTRPPLVVLPEAPPPPPPPPPSPEASPGSNDDIGELIPIHPYPSPGQEMALSVHLRAAAAVKVDLFDVQGRRAARLVDRWLPAGTTVITWDGRRPDGTRAQRGIYFLRFSTPRGSRVRRTILLP